MAQVNQATQAAPEVIEPAPIQTAPETGDAQAAPMTEAFQAGEQFAKAEIEGEAEYTQTRRIRFVAAWDKYGHDEKLQEQWLNGYASGYGKDSGKIRKSEAAALFRCLGVTEYREPGVQNAPVKSGRQIVEDFTGTFAQLLTKARQVAPAGSNSGNKSGGKRFPSKAVDTLRNTLNAIPASSVESNADAISELSMASIHRLPVAHRAVIAKKILGGLPDEIVVEGKVENLKEEIQASTDTEKTAKIMAIVKTMEHAKRVEIVTSICDMIPDQMILDSMAKLANALKLRGDKHLQEIGALMLDIINNPVEETAPNAAQAATA